MHLQEMLRRNVKFTRELLTDGYLMREGLIDREKLDELFTDRPSALETRPAELFGFIGTEAWLQTWGRQPLRAVA